MAVKHLDWDFSKRGQEDVARHQKKIKDSIKKNISDIVSEESIITRKKGQTVKVPVKGIKDYYFKHTSRTDEQGEKYGLGHGSGKKGQVVGRQKNEDSEAEGPGKGKGKPGDQPGEDYLEAEIDMEEVVKMMMDDLSLPDLRKKEVAETVVQKGWTFDSVDRHGIKSNLDKKRTIREAIKKSSRDVSDLSTKTGFEKSICQKAYNHTKGNFDKALKLLQEDHSVFANEDEKLKPFISNQNLRYRTIKEDAEIHSNAVILAMMDVSGSMTTMKKYLARSFFFWMVEFLKHRYRHVEIRFIAHTTDAKLVDENEFFHKGESGGTACSSAYELACDLIDSQYPVDKWNVYGFHFSDGEDWSPADAAKSMKKLINKNINMMGYGQIETETAYGKTLMEELKHTFDLEQVSGKTKYYSSNDEFESYVTKNKDVPFVGVVLRDKEHVWYALKSFFSKTKEKF